MEAEKFKEILPERPPVGGAEAGEAKKAEAPTPSPEEKKAPSLIISPPPPAGEEGAAPLPKDEELIIIENILSEDILDLYKELSPMKQRAFRRRGEEAALKIKIILHSARVRVREIFEIIKNWLLLLPKINKFFLEQEAKIKTDKMLELKRRGQEIER